MSFKTIGELLEDNSEEMSYMERMARLNSPNGDIYGGKSAEEILLEIDGSRVYKTKGGFNCDLCGNKGGKMVPNEHGLLIWEGCSCLENKKTLFNTEKSGLGDLLNYRVSDFEVTEPFQRHMKDATSHYLLYGQKRWFLALGQPGCGKTMLCSAICNQRLNKGHVVKYLIWKEFVSKMHHMKYDQDREYYYQEYVRAEILYIDDLLKGKVTEYERDLAFQIINYRYNKDLVTVISSELLIEDLRKLDEAIASRMYQKARFKDDDGKTLTYVLEIGRDDKKNYRFK